MKLFFSCVLSVATIMLTAQTQVLKKEKTDSLFSAEVKKTNGINFPIYKAIEFKDKAGTHIFLATESSDSISGKDTLNKKIKGLCFALNGKTLKKEWELNDLTGKDIQGSKERSIWFWTKFCSFEDIDKDGMAEPIIVYGSHGSNYYDDGRIKILIYYKGKKVAIRHQNGVLDFERKTLVDKEFYLLPAAIQQEIKVLMMNIAGANKAIFPAGWQEGMKKKKTELKE